VEEPDNDETTASTDMEGPLVFINGNGLTQEDAMGWLLRGALESELKGPKMDYFNALEGLSAADTPKLFQLLPTIKDPAVRQFIVMQLQTKADAETIQNVVDHFDQTSDPEEKKLMLEILQHMSSPSSAPLLTNAVRDDGIASNDLVVTACVKALAALGDESGLTAVLDRVSREQDVVLRYDLFTGMMNAGNPAVKNFLLRTAQGGAGVTAPVRQSAVYALRAYGDPETLRLLQEVSQCAVPSIAAAAQDSLEAIERVR
jgi:HEAT repeat protein